MHDLRSSNHSFCRSGFDRFAFGCSGFGSLDLSLFGPLGFTLESCFLGILYHNVLDLFLPRIRSGPISFQIASWPSCWHVPIWHSTSPLVGDTGTTSSIWATRWSTESWLTRYIYTHRQILATTSLCWRERVLLFFHFQTNLIIIVKLQTLPFKRLSMLVEKWNERAVKR